MKKFDVVIVGAGSAGCIIANRLSADPAISVLLVEAGRATPPVAEVPALWGTMLNTEFDWSYHTVAQQACMGRRLYWPRGKMMGGSSAINAMIYLRGLPSDFDRWAADGCEGWSYEKVLPYFRRSERNTRFGDSRYHGTDGEWIISDNLYNDPMESLWVEAAMAAGMLGNDDFNGESQEGVGHFQANIAVGRRQDLSTAFIEPIRSRRNLTIMTAATVTGVQVEGGKATGISLLVNGVSEQIAAGKVVLSAGAIGSPHLLLLSGIGPEHALASVGKRVIHDLPGVGRNLRDHINVAVTFESRAPVGLYNLDKARHAELESQWRTTGGGPFASNWSSTGGFVRSSPDILEPDLQIYGTATSNRDHGRFLLGKPGVTLFSVVQRPKSSGDITLRSTDPLEHPAINPCYLTDEGGEDLALLMKGVRINRHIAAQSPLAEYLVGEIGPGAHARHDNALIDFIRGHCQTLFHPTSTCKMGTDAMAVVDPKLKVHGIDDLFVADASIFPTMISANTNAATVMVGERAADFIRNV